MPESNGGYVFSFTCDTGIGTQLTVNGKFEGDATSSDMIIEIQKLRKVAQYFLDHENMENIKAELKRLELERTGLERTLTEKKEVVGRQEEDGVGLHPLITQLENALHNNRVKREDAQDKLTFLMERYAAP